MIETIERTKRLYDIFSQTGWELSGFSVLEGNNPGRIWIDRENDPCFAIMSTPEGVLLAGDPTANGALDDLRDWFEKLYLPEGTEADDYCFEIYFDPKWHDAAQYIFESRELINYPRLHFLIDRECERPKQSMPPEEFQPRAITPEFLDEARSYRNIDQIDSWITNNWGDIDNYRENGFGHCYLHNDIIVCWSVSDCRFQDRCEIGIETDPSFRRQGLATATVSRMLDHAFENGYREVGWQCPASNHGSVRTARKAGFTLEREYLGHEGYFDRSRHILIQGYNELYHRKSTVTAIEYFDRCMSENPSNPKIVFDLACGYALAKSPDRAFEALERAIRQGFRKTDYYMNSEHLAGLRTDPRWKNIIALLESSPG